MRISIYLFIILFFFAGETFSNEKNKDLLELKKLLDAGIINIEEYNSAKKIINEKDFRKKKVLEPKIETTNEKIEANDSRNFAIYINLETNKFYKGASHNSLSNAIKIAKRNCLNDLKDTSRNYLCQKIEENGFSYSKARNIQNKYDISDLKKRYLPTKTPVTNEVKIKKVLEPKIETTNEKIEALACGVETWKTTETKGLEKYWDIFIFSNTNKSCKEIGNKNWKKLSYSKYEDIRKNPSKYSEMLWSTKSKSYYTSDALIENAKKKICINNKTKKINNLSQSCSNKETELYVFSGNENNLFLSQKNQITEVAKTAEAKKKVKVEKTKQIKKISFCKLKNNFRIVKKEKCIGSFKKITQEDYVIGYLALSGDNLKKSQNQLRRLKKQFKSNDIDLPFIDKTIKKNSNLRIYAKLLDPQNIIKIEKKNIVKSQEKIIDTKKTEKIVKVPKKVIKKKIQTNNENVVKKEISAWEKSVLIAIENEKDFYCEEDIDRRLFEVDKKKEKIKFFDLNKLFVSKKYCLIESEILMLGEYEKMKLPSIFLEKQKGCKTNACMRTKSGSEVYKLFVKKGPRFHAKNPGAMIEGMSWFEILYHRKLKETQSSIDRYNLNNYKDIKQLLKFQDEAKIHSLIKMNKSRIKMREALGFSLYDRLEDVIAQQILLAEFLNKDQLKVVENKISPTLTKRKELIDRYKLVLTRYKEKLEEEKQKKINENKKL